MRIMEQESFFSEKSSFANKNYKKYGTTTNYNNLKRNQPTEILIRHEVSKSDTMQGIALKYGCSVSKKIFIVSHMISTFPHQISDGADS